MRRLGSLTAVIGVVVALVVLAIPVATGAPSCASATAGTAGNDIYEGTSGDDAFDGRGGDDTISGNRGDDRISSSNGLADAVDCGTGSDRVVADRSDHLVGCERVHYAVSPYPVASPRSGGARTTFTVFFRALYAAGRGRGQYVVGLVHGGGACRTGYSSLGKVSKSAIEIGDIVRFRLAPGPHGGWCRGRFRGVAHWERGSSDIRLGRFFFRVR